MIENGGKDMNLEQITSRYKENNLGDFKLKSVVDLFNIHDVDYSTINGFVGLSEKNKKLFMQMIVKFYNLQGLELRMAMVPKKIHCIKQQIWWDGDKLKEGIRSSIQSSYEILEPDDEEEIVYEIEEYHDNQIEKLQHAVIQTVYYLRFEYIRYGRRDIVNFDNTLQWW